MRITIDGQRRPSMLPDQIANITRVDILPTNPAIPNANHGFFWALGDQIVTLPGKHTFRVDVVNSNGQPQGVQVRGGRCAAGFWYTC